MLTDEELREKYNSKASAQQISFASDTLDRVSEVVDNAIEWSKDKFQKAGSILDGPSNDKALSSLGNLSDGDERFSETKQKLIKCISAVWDKNDNTTEQGKIHNQANRLRKFNDENITKAYLLNDSDGAGTMGHNAIMLVDNEGKGLIFSVYPSGVNYLNTNAELRFSALSAAKVNELVKNNGNPTNIYDMPATDGAIANENYNRFLEYDISAENGKKMFEFAVNRYDMPGKYFLFSENCDTFSVDCLNAGGIDIKGWFIPNITQ